MIEQAADVGMMQSLGGRGRAVGFRNIGITHESLDQSLEAGILKTGHKTRQSLPQLANVLGGFGKIIGEVDFGIA